MALGLKVKITCCGDDMVTNLRSPDYFLTKDPSSLGPP